ncbi:MAG: 30S ribosomal protein S12 methylthiotransferase RimO [Clostridiales bacterium]|nr:30S ribosomal protein S12 methylthiotransferase RimO [Clostridiales bacterium]
MAIKVALISLGCPKNQVDSEQMLSMLKDAGMKHVTHPDGADVAIVNTCGFIESAVNEGLSEIFALSELKKEGRLKKIIVTGCIPERYKGEFLKELPEVDFALGTGSCQKIVDAVTETLENHRAACFDDINLSPISAKRVLLSPTHSAYIKIAEGCDNHCAYCIIPKIRGRFRSRPEEEILKEAETLVQSGVKELIVVAQDITRYGVDLYREHRLANLLKKMCQIPNVEWIRLHYLYPDEIDDRLLDVIASDKKILHYFDIPIQHISDKILTLMNRRGNRAFIEALFEKIRTKMPDAVLRTSIIAGLPGETDVEFSELCDFMKKEKLPRAGIFSYSQEEGSAAAAMENQVDDETKSRRMEILGDIQYSVMEEYNERQIGRVLKILCEGFDPDSGSYYGRSYADSPEIDSKVYFHSDQPVSAGQFVSVRITGAVDSDLIGNTAFEEGEPA